MNLELKMTIDEIVDHAEYNLNFIRTLVKENNMSDSDYAKLIRNELLFFLKEANKL